MHLLVTSLCSHDLIVMSLVVKLIGTWFLDSELSTCCLGSHICEWICEKGSCMHNYKYLEIPF